MTILDEKAFQYNTTPQIQKMTHYPAHGLLPPLYFIVGYGNGSLVNADDDDNNNKK